MSIHHIKSQATLVSTTRTQIGSRPMLGISMGVGFRLSDPAVLVHETAVWEALKEVTQSVPLAEFGMPKRHAEWLLVGRSVHRASAGSVGRPVDWTQSVPLAEFGMPKRHAEWLLVGRSVHRASAGSVGRPVDWAAWVELDGVLRGLNWMVFAKPFHVGHRLKTAWNSVCWHGW
ncbi:hypothetical protein BGV52_22015 [Burkholderia ubonensis]|nr:hypothetical protein [Burkholderia ubonensis]OJB06773.1 hypothetical protein BGV52_22015 [Burkholderia ubonensis]